MRRALQPELLPCVSYDAINTLVRNEAQKELIYCEFIANAFSRAGSQDGWYATLEWTEASQPGRIQNRATCEKVHPVHQRPLHLGCGGTLFRYPEIFGGNDNDETYSAKAADLQPKWYVHRCRGARSGPCGERRMRKSGASSINRLLRHILMRRFCGCIMLKDAVTGNLLDQKILNRTIVLALSGCLKSTGNTASGS